MSTSYFLEVPSESGEQREQSVREYDPPIGRGWRRNTAIVCWDSYPFYWSSLTSTVSVFRWPDRVCRRRCPWVLWPGVGSPASSRSLTPHLRFPAALSETALDRVE